MTGLLIQSLRKTEVQPDIQQSPESESLIPAIQLILALGGFLASTILLAVEPSEGRGKEDKCRLSSSLSSRPGVLKTHTHRTLQVKTDTCIAQMRNWGPAMGGDLPKVSRLIASRAEARAPECRRSALSRPPGTHRLTTLQRLILPGRTYM